LLPAPILKRILTFFTGHGPRTLALVDGLSEWVAYYYLNVKRLANDNYQFWVEVRVKVKVSIRVNKFSHLSIGSQKENVQR